MTQLDSATRGTGAAPPRPGTSPAAVKRVRLFGPVHWTAALAMAVGCLAGGWCGPPVVKRLPAEPLRIVVGIGGLALAVWLALG